MKAISFSRFGRASEVASLIDIPEPPRPGSGQVLIEVEISPINPSDLLHFAGHYGQQGLLPAYAGSGVLGRIIQSGSDVHLKRGDRVIVLDPQRSAWQARFIWPAAHLFALPDADPIALALLAANPPTALLMLEIFCDLQPGDWIIQNAANSSVGLSVIQIAKTKHLHTVNIVRRPDLADNLRGFGADVVLVDGDNLRERVTDAVGERQIQLALDAVAGNATRRLAQCLNDGGTVVNYGLLSGEACGIDASDIIFRDISLRGFWYTRWYSAATVAAVKAVYMRLAAMVQAGILRVPCEAIYPVDQYANALAHAERDGRAGKIVMRWSQLRQANHLHANASVSQAFPLCGDYLIACGLMGEPVPPVMMSGGPQKKNS